jgi:hypothetical protein
MNDVYHLCQHVVMTISLHVDAENEAKHEAFYIRSYEHTARHQILNSHLKKIRLFFGHRTGIRKTPSWR